MIEADVAVVGGGPAGLAAAIAAAQQGLRVTLLERNQAPVQRIGETVPADVLTPLADLGAWPAFAAQGHLRSTGRASAWQEPELRRSDAFALMGGAGWHLDRCRFESLLRDRAIAAGAGVRASTRVIGIELSPRQLGQHGRTGGQLHAVEHGGRRITVAWRVLVDATGAAATVSRWLGARRRIHDRLVCAYARAEGSCRAHKEGRSLVEATEDGWWYATPLPGGGALAAVFCDPRTVRARGYAVPTRWRAALNRTRHVAQYVEPGAVAVALSPVTLHRLDRAAGQDWLAIGDAAAALDPLSSAGITLALRDGIAAAAAVQRRLMGDPQALLDHAGAIEHWFARYLAQRRDMYALPPLWRDAPFWRSRTEATDAEA